MVRLIPRLELNIVTGFLGSGKTTLLKRYLQQQPVGSTLVIINEFGRESIDNHLTMSLTSEIETIANGCLCCTVLETLQETLIQILTRRMRGELPALQRIIVETSGLADPTPILGTILTDENLNEYITAGPCITAFDALEGCQTLTAFTEAATQLAAADRVVVTKSDLADNASIGGVMDVIRSINPACQIMLNDVPEAIFAPLEHNAPIISQPFPTDRPAHAHTSAVSSFSAVLDKTVDWATFSVWLTALLNRHGDRILRFKSALAVRATGKLVVQGVRHRVYPPSHLPAMPDEDNVSRLVFITKDMPEREILESLQRFSAAASTQLSRASIGKSFAPGFQTNNF